MRVREHFGDIANHRDRDARFDRPEDERAGERQALDDLVREPRAKIGESTGLVHAHDPGMR